MEAETAGPDVARDSYPSELKPLKDEEEAYLESLVRVSLLLVSRNSLPEVQHHGSKMLQHLLKFRSKKLSSPDHLDLTVELAAQSNELALKSGTIAFDNTLSKAAKPKEPKKPNRSLLVLATENNLRTIALEKTGHGGSEDEGAVDATTTSQPTSSPQSTFLSLGKSLSAYGGQREDFSLVLDPNSYSSPTSSSSSSSSSSTPRPIDGPVPLSYFGLGLDTQPMYSSAQKILIYGPESDEFTTSSSSLDSTESSPDTSDWFSESSTSDLGNGNITLTDTGEAISCHQGIGSLLVEHNFLCEAFVLITSCSRIHHYLKTIPCLLDSLNKIWTQKEWHIKYMDHATGLRHLFGNVQFLKMVYYVVKFFEEELKRSKIEVSDASGICSITILQSILPILLQLLQCIHALWTADVPRGLSEELERAKSLSSVELARMLESTDGLYNIDNEECFHENETRALLEGIRQRVYNIVGLCTSVEGAFSELLDSFSVSAAFLNDLGSMEFRHLGKLIRLVVIPLVTHCPRKFWKEWVINFLQPLLSRCENMLHDSWFTLLYHGRARAPYYFGNLAGLDEKVNELEQKLLLVFTHEVSGLLGVLALEEQSIVLLHEDERATNSIQFLESVSSSSLFRLLLFHDCFGMLRVSLFGYFVDDEVAVKAIPFCQSLICLAVASSDMKLRFFISNDLLPCLIRRLDNQLPCAIQRLRHKWSSSASDNASRDLVILCRQLYGYLLKLDLAEGKDSGLAESNFTIWLAKQKEDLRVKASSAAKEHTEELEWNWEFEDEFQMYLPIYMDILKEVDAIPMDNNKEHDYLEEETLFQKLKPEFRSKYGINSCVHPHMVTISSLRQQQFHFMQSIIRSRKICRFVKELIKLKPYIECSDCTDDTMERLEENSEIPAELSDCYDGPPLLHYVLFFWEPIFHPLIREGHMQKLFSIVDRLTKASLTKSPKQVVPYTTHFPLHLEPYAYTFIEAKVKESMYYSAIEQIHLHEDFDNYLASGKLDHRMDEFMSSKDAFVEDLVMNDMSATQFSNLNYGLIKLSFERRAEIVETKRELCTYSECLRCVLQNEPLKCHLVSLMNELKTEGFFNTFDETVNWEKKRFTELVDEFDAKVFAGHSLPKHYVIRGIIDYQSISMRRKSSWQDAFKEVVDEVCDRWIENCEQFWMETRYYEHLYYDIVRKPLKHVFCIG